MEVILENSWHQHFLLLISFQDQKSMSFQFCFLLMNIFRLSFLINHFENYRNKIIFFSFIIFTKEHFDKVSVEFPSRNAIPWDVSLLSTIILSENKWFPLPQKSILYRVAKFVENNEYFKELFVNKQKAVTSLHLFFVSFKEDNLACESISNTGAKSPVP